MQDLQRLSEPEDLALTADSMEYLAASFAAEGGDCEDRIYECVVSEADADAQTFAARVGAGF